MSNEPTPILDLTHVTGIGRFSGRKLALGPILVSTVPLVVAGSAFAACVLLSQVLLGSWGWGLNVGPVVAAGLLWGLSPKRLDGRTQLRVVRDRLVGLRTSRRSVGFGTVTAEPTTIRLVHNEFVEVWS